MPEIREHYSTVEVADMLKVSVDTIRAWRSKTYAKSRKKLVGEALTHKSYIYSIDVLEEWLQRNPEYRPRLAHWKAPRTMPQTLLGSVVGIMKQPTLDWFGQAA